MKTPCLTAACLACAFVTGAPPLYAEDGRIVFTGDIVEPVCPLRDGALHCPPGRQAFAAIRPLDIASARQQIRAELFDYALQRDRTAAWQVVDITYR